MTNHTESLAWFHFRNGGKGGSESLMSQETVTLNLTGGQKRERPESKVGVTQSRWQEGEERFPGRGGRREGEGGRHVAVPGAEGSPVLLG